MMLLSGGQWQLSRSEYRTVRASGPSGISRASPLPNLPTQQPPAGGRTISPPTPETPRPPRNPLPAAAPCLLPPTATLPREALVLVCWSPAAVGRAAQDVAGAPAVEIAPQPSACVHQSEVEQIEQKKQAAADVLFHYSQFVMVCIGEGVRPTDLRLHLMKEVSGMPTSLKKEPQQAAASPDSSEPSSSGTMRDKDEEWKTIVQPTKAKKVEINENLV
ncbi:hypothetical protein GUJ93_ZPchr0005g16362 [Zizania palustris]|uniref:Uncharacterized protein n=1 Tax=Zizania palustris TaxID=103762 RepID=A0A8J5SMY7_ZIZPA|nr:hypothetical protein GUJ93_ZPchr0005g16362 [Zizania palustris]